MAAPPYLRRQILLFSILCISAACSSAVEQDEIESMLILLRSRGHTLFSNAIATSDLLYDITTTTATASSSAAFYTFFAPNESSLFALDMTDTASEYTAALRCHVIPYRLTYNQLHHFPSGYAQRTLVKNHHIHIRNRSDEIYIDNVRLVAPGLFYGRRIAVHGLEGILNCRRLGKESTAARQIHAPEPAEFDRYSPIHSPALQIHAPVPAAFGGYSPTHSPEAVHFSPPRQIHVPEPAEFDGHSPETAHLPPSYGPTPSTFRRRKTPGPEYSEIDDPASFGTDEDWISGVDREEEEREKAVLRSFSPSDLSEIIGSEPFKGRSYDDCHVTTNRIYPRGYCANG